MFWRVVLTGVFLSLSLLVSAQEQHCAETISLACGNAPSAVFDHDGKLWVAFEQGEQIYVTSSDDLGASFSKPVVVNTTPEPIYAKGENRPKLAFGSRGEVLVSWTRKMPARFTGDIRFTRSLDGGKTFSQPYTVNDDGLQTSHRFDALYVTASGKIFLTWLDKRDQVRHRAQGQGYHGAALYYAVSENGGESFSSNIKVADHSCECCRIAIDGYSRDEVAVMWRHIYDGTTRDHAIAILGTEGYSTPVRSTIDDWQINACPHHGPDIALSDNGESYHMVWFSSGNLHKGLYYDRFALEDGKPNEPLSVDSRPGAGHPQVAVVDSAVFLLWKYFDGEATELKLMKSVDDGGSWAEPESVLSTAGGSDHPQLLKRGNEVYAGWHSSDEGYRIVEVN